MTANPLSDHGYDEEERHFHEKDLVALKAIRSRLDAARAASASGARVDNWMRCPKCGKQLKEVEVEQVKIDRCTGCGGVFLDQGELEILTHARSGFLPKLFAKW
jgi:uncharacterized protein